MRATFLLLLVLPFSSIVQGKRVTCSARKTAQGVSAISTFSTCSGLSQSEIMTIAKQINEPDVKASLQDRADGCAALESDEEKQRCHAHFISSLAEEDVLPSHAISAGDDQSSTARTNLIKTCGCLTNALKTMPDCGKFSSFLEIEGILPTKKGVCEALGTVCSEMSSLATDCPVLETSEDAKKIPAGTYRDPQSCAGVAGASEICDRKANLFWLAGADGVTYCGLEMAEHKRLKAFYDECPHESATTTDASFYDSLGGLTPEQGRLFAGIIVFTFIASCLGGAGFWVWKKSQRFAHEPAPFTSISL